jgi:LacI family transcriptional regulator
MRYNTLALTLTLTKEFSTMPERITMAQVARQAGVSLMTVSRVINNKEGVGEVTRSRVQAIIEQLGYRPSDIARGLVTKRTGTLGLVIPDVANPFYAEVVRGAEHLAYEEGYNVFLCNTEEDTQRELDVLQSLVEKRVDGVVVCSSRLGDDELEETVASHPAAVLINRRLDSDDVGSVLIDDSLGGKMATRHLLQTGHKAIGFLAGPSASYSGRWRAGGYRAALAAAGEPYNPDRMRHCSPMVEGGREAALELLAAQPDLTALFCYNDLVAIGALQACADLGRSVPDDIAIVGFDDIPLAALVTPPLTTCHVPRLALGSEAMRLLLGKIKGRDGETCKEVLLRPKLVVRSSAP